MATHLWTFGGVFGGIFGKNNTELFGGIIRRDDSGFLSATDLVRVGNAKRLEMAGNFETEVMRNGL